MKLKYSLDKDYYEKDSSSLESYNYISLINLCIKMCNCCNLKCEYCLENSIYGYESIEDYSREVLKAKERIFDLFGPIRIVFSGGEPLLSKKFTEIIEQYVNCKYKINISTNLLSDDNSKLELLKNNYLWVDISLHGYDEKSYLKIRGYNGFKRVCENVMFIKNSKCKIKINIPIIEEIVHNSNKMIEVLKHIQPSMIRTFWIENMGRVNNNYINENNVKNYADINKFIEELRKIAPTIYSDTPHSFENYFILEKGNIINDGKQKISIYENKDNIDKYLSAKIDNHQKLFIHNE